MKPRWLLAFVVALSGCGRTHHDGKSPPVTAAGGAGGTETPGMGGDPGNSAGAPDMPCNTPDPGPAPLGRLRNTELNNSVRALLPPGAGQQLPWLPVGDRYQDAPDTQLDETAIQRMRDLAHAVALELTNGDFLAGCDVTAQGEEACRDALAVPLLERIYRRPLTDEDREELAGVYATGRKLGGDFKSGMRAVVEVALQSPDFMYLVELGSDHEEGNVVQLTGYESAARLAYFLTAAPPDDTLLKAAKNGPFSAEELQAQAERLLATPDSRLAISSGYMLDVGLDVGRDNPTMSFTPELAQDAAEASRRFVEDVVFDGPGTLQALFTEPYTWVNDSLATFYGNAAPNGAWQKVELDPTRWSGLFTQPAFLTRSSHGPSFSGVQRGTQVLARVLCYDVPPPPPNVEQLDAPDPRAVTQRQQLDSATREPACWDCHHYINPVGFAFDHYDAVGKWRDTENGVPVNSSGELDRTGAKGAFKDAVGLLENIAASTDAKSCFVQQWLARAERHLFRANDASCRQRELTRGFVASGGQIMPLLRGISATDSFRYRLKSELLNGGE